MIRNTRQRRAILEVIQHEHRPLTVVEVHALAIRTAPRIGLRTVYRNVRELVEDGKLVCVSYPGQPPRYESVGDRKPRPHLICTVCNKVFELDMPFPDPATEQIEGFVVEGVEKIYYGHCADPSACPHRPKS
ncbi:MAG TPA: transcriptional repressor [Opitutales bacterium]|nr:transcriptional repressor [Opitutales bacterium]